MPPLYNGGQRGEENHAGAEGKYLIQVGQHVLGLYTGDHFADQQEQPGHNALYGWAGDQPEHDRF